MFVFLHFITYLFNYLSLNLCFGTFFAECTMFITYSKFCSLAQFKSLTDWLTDWLTGTISHLGWALCNTMWLVKQGTLYNTLMWCNSHWTSMWWNFALSRKFDTFHAGVKFIVMCNCAYRLTLTILYMANASTHIFKLDKTASAKY